MPSRQDKKGVIPQIFHGITPATRHYPELVKIALMPSSALGVLLLLILLLRILGQRSFGTGKKNASSKVLDRIEHEHGAAGADGRDPSRAGHAHARSESVGRGVAALDRRLSRVPGSKP